MSLRWKEAEAPVRAADRGDPVSQRFSDQLIAVLPRLRRFARGLTGSATEADDLVQAACERALAREHQFQEGTRFDSWMFRIVQTVWIDQLRAREVRKEDSDVPEERLGSDAPVRTIEARLALAEDQPKEIVILAHAPNYRLRRFAKTKKRCLMGTAKLCGTRRSVISICSPTFLDVD